MKNLSTGTGLCIAGLCAVAFPFAQKLANVDSEAHAGVQASAIAAVSSAATIQVTPTIVWYHAVSNPIARAGSSNSVVYSGHFWLLRGWSDGRVEARSVFASSSPLDWCSGSTTPPCIGEWVVISDPNQGYSAASDINFDSKVDGSDLGQLLASWGNAPRQDIPPSDCPLALINP
jgi:hypothetical protein